MSCTVHCTLYVGQGVGEHDKALTNGVPALTTAGWRCSW